MRNNNAKIAYAGGFLHAAFLCLNQVPPPHKPWPSQQNSLAICNRLSDSSVLARTAAEHYVEL
jgi:hypothetical protein